ncbi:glycosyltransferase, group 1 family protein [Leptospira inadai serovar Lyme str. 10]|uniref:Glycosyltransferase, group 1 family protein n=2 Tax=Leptospira inadai serovar Lyme TaxID=293084 RepID=V6HIW1_9LEPT|nr:glycosyltransferase family 1 protein [Leptospira inadai]EQA36715.1 glycosyltransferase, group 1 family protein [Leptospira inadai serovar Lyme str. 10]
MKVLFDHQIFSLQKHGGISRYFSNLIRGFRQESSFGIEAELSLEFSSNEYVRETWNPKFYNQFFPHDFGIPGKRRLLRYANLPFSLAKLISNEFDVFHPTYYFPYFLPFLRDKPFVLTVYDLIHEKYPDDFKDDRTTDYKPILIEKADRIISISECTKRDLLKTYKISEDKVETILLSIDQNVKFLKSEPVFLPEGKFILFVGGRGTYKNFQFLLEYLPLFFKENPSSFLVCAGGGRFNRIEMEKIQEADLEDRVIQLDVDEARLRYLYRNAHLFIFPSLYEGFGLPVLESMANGCVPLLANRSSLPEVGGDAAFYFDPESGASFLESLEDAWRDGPTRSRILRLGSSRILDFSWEKTIAETASVYRKVAFSKVR